jgi:hypothetical protein
MAFLRTGEWDRTLIPVSPFLPDRECDEGDHTQGTGRYGQCEGVVADCVGGILPHGRDQGGNGISTATAATATDTTAAATRHVHRRELNDLFVDDWTVVTMSGCVWCVVLGCACLINNTNAVHRI